MQEIDHYYGKEIDIAFIGAYYICFRFTDECVCGFHEILGIG